MFVRTLAGASLSALMVAGGLAVLPAASAAPAASAGTTYHVTTKFCQGPGSITDAIAKANANPGTDTISVDVPTMTFMFAVGDCTAHYWTNSLHNMTDGPAHAAVMRITDSVVIEGNNATIDTSPMWVDSSGQLNVANAGQCPANSNNNKLVGYAVGMVEVGDRLKPNPGLKVTIRNLVNSPTTQHGGFEYLAKVNSGASLTFDGIQASEMANAYNCNEPFIDVATSSNLTIRNSEFSSGINLGSNLGGDSFISGGPAAGNLTITDSTFYDLQNARAILWGGTAASKVNIVTSQFQGAGGFSFNNSGPLGTVMDASIVNSLVRLGNLGVPDDLSAGDQILATSRASSGGTHLAINGSSITMNNNTCTTSVSSGQCSTAMPAVIAATGPNARISMEHTAVGVMTPNDPSNNWYLYATNVGSTLSADQYTWTQTTNKENAASIKNVLGNAVQTSPPTDGLWRYGFVAGNNAVLPILSGGLVDAIPNAAGTPVEGPNALMNPIDGKPILKDIFGHPRWDVTGATTIGAVQVMAASLLSVAGVGDSHVDLTWTAAPDLNPAAPVTGYRVTYQPVAGGPARTQDFPGNTVFSGTINGLTNGTPYKFTVRPLSILGAGPVSNVVKATPLGEVRSPVVSASPSGDGTLRVSWTEPDLRGNPGPVVYDVFIRPFGSPTWTTIREGISGRILQIPGLTNGQKYEIGVAATASNGARSPQLGLTTATPYAAPGLSYPTPLSVYRDNPLTVKPTTTALVGTPTYTVQSGSLPTGTSLDPATGIISGTPTTKGAYDVTVRVTDGTSGLSTDTAVHIDVVRPLPNPWIAYADVLVEMGQGAVSVTPTQSAAVSGATFSITSGSLPAGMKLNANTGVITGTPTAATGGFVTATITRTSGADKVLAPFAMAVLPTVAYRNTQYAEVGDTLSIPARATLWSGGRFTVSATTPLPAGLTINPATGDISGTVTAEGIFPVTVLYTTGLYSPQPQWATSNTIAIVVLPAKVPPTLAYPSQVTSPVDTPLSVTPTIGSLTGSPALTVESGKLPAGMFLNASTGAIDGVPTKIGTTTVTIQLRDRGTGLTVNSTITFTITKTQPNAALYYPDSTSTVYNAVSMSPTLTGDIGKNYAFSITDGTLPAGMTLDAVTGIISGYPTKPTGGVVSLTIAAKWNGGMVQGPVDLTVLPAVRYTNELNGIIGHSVSIKPAATTWSGGRFTLAKGSVLPSGLTLNPVTGVISGTPTKVAATTVVVNYTTGLYAPQPTVVASNPIAIHISAPATAPRLTYATPIIVSRDTPMSTTPTIIGLVGQPTFAVTSGRLPAGLTLDKATGVISGTPTTNGTSTAKITVTDTVTQQKSTAPISITVVNPGQNPALYYPDVVAIAGHGPVVLSPTLTGISGRPTYSITEGTLPKGLQLNPVTGVISGTPTTPTGGYVSLTIKATVGGQVVQGPVVIAVEPTMTYPSVSYAVSGQHATITPQATLWTGGKFTLGKGSALPAGMSLNPTTGVLSGTPTVNGTYSITVLYSTGLQKPYATAISQQVTVTVGPKVGCDVNVQAVGAGTPLPQGQSVDIINHATAGAGCTLSPKVTAGAGISVVCHASGPLTRGDLGCTYVVGRDGRVTVRTPNRSATVVVTIAAKPVAGDTIHTASVWQETWHTA